MFSKTAFVFVAVALSAFNVNALPAPHKADGCDITATVTVLPTTSIAPPAGTLLPIRNGTLITNPGNNQNNNGGAAGNNNGKGNQGQNNGKGNNNGKGGNNNGKGGNNNNGKGGNKGGDVSSSAAATATDTASSAAASATAPPTGSNNNTNTGGNNGGNGGGNNGGDPQTSLTLDPAVIAKGFANDGQDVPAAGQVASLTSTNNFINFCLTVPNLPLTNGQQIKGGSCNPAPMGVIPSSNNMPSSKFTTPPNFGTIKANTAFTITMAISHLETGNFVNANENYFSAPQQINGQGDVRGHSHVVVEQIDSLTQTTVTDPTKFVFFKGLNEKANGGVLSADVTNGLPAGVYRLASINTAANHQPILGPIAQHGSFDDMIYFTITEDGQAAGGNNDKTGAGANGGNNGTASAAPSASASASAAPSASASAAAGGNKTGNQGGNKNQNGRGGNNGNNGANGRGPRGQGAGKTRRWL